MEPPHLSSLTFSGLYSVNIIKIKKSPLIEPNRHWEVQGATGPQDVVNLKGNCVKRILPRDNNDREERIASRDNT